MTDSGADAVTGAELAYVTDDQAQQLPAVAGDITRTGDTRSHVVAGRNGGTLTPIRSPERAREMQRLGQIKKQRIIREGLTAAARQSDQLPADATHWDWLRLAAENHGTHALVPGEPGSGQSLRWAVDNAYPKPDHDGDSSGAPSGNADLDDLLYAHRQRVASDPDYAARVAELRRRRLSGG